MYGNLYFGQTYFGGQPLGTTTSTTTTTSTSTSTSSTTTSSSTSSTTTSSSTSSTTTSSSTTRSTSTSTSSTTTSSSTSSTTTSSSTTQSTSTSTSTSISTTTSTSQSTSTSTSMSTSTTTLDYIYKRYNYKIYTGTTYITTWVNEVISEPHFRNSINGGPGELIIKLARKFDDFGEDVDVKLDNRVDLYIYDRQQPNGLLLYRGFISGYRPVLDNNKEYVEVTVLSYVYELANYMLRDGSGNTTVAYNSQDPSAILQDVIDKYRADGGTLNYSATSIANTNTTVSYTFNTNTTREAIDKIVELAPVGWYWTVDSASIIHFKSKNALADHTFAIGKDINYMETWRRTEDIINDLYFTGFTTQSGTGMFRRYTNSSSISSYGRHVSNKVDQRVTITTTADTMATTIVNTKKDPEIRTRLVLLDNNGYLQNRGFDIESIISGDTIKILNIKQSVKTYSRWDQFQWDVDVWDQTLATTAASVIQILLCEYTPNALTIEASSRLPEVSKRIEDINRNLVNEQTVNNPTIPVAGN